MRGDFLEAVAQEPEVVEARGQSGQEFALVGTSSKKSLNMSLGRMMGSTPSFPLAP